MTTRVFTWSQTRVLRALEAGGKLLVQLYLGEIYRAELWLNGGIEFEVDKRVVASLQRAGDISRIDANGECRLLRPMPPKPPPKRRVR